MSFHVGHKYTCRTCLRHTSLNTCVSLHKVIELKNGTSSEMIKMIEECIGLQISELDNSISPPLICEQCTSIITNFYLFRLECLKNNIQLREQFENVDFKCEVKVESADWSKIETNLSDDPIQDHYTCSEHEDDSNSIKNFGTKETDSMIKVPKIKANVSHDPFNNHYSSSDHDVTKVCTKITNKKPESFNEIEIPKIEINISVDPFSDYHSSSGNEGDSKTRKNQTNKATESLNEVPKIHECDICFASFDARKDLVHHRREHHLHEINEEHYTIVKKGTLTHYICKICKHFCRHKDSLRVHLRSHTGEKPYKCSICPESFTQKCTARKHMETIHSDNIQKTPMDKKRKIFYRCELCNKGFQIESKLKLHYEEEHPDNQTRNYVSVIPNGVEQLCDICGKFMKCLTAHLRAHSGAKQFECNICGKHLATASSLYQHRQRHSDEKNYICDTCGKKFKLKHDLTFHRKVHNQVRKHACHLCEQKFLHKVGLRIHLQAHAGERPYHAHNDRKRERRRLKRLEMIKNGIPFPMRKSRKKETTKQDD